jgi:hypothetical protein
MEWKLALAQHPMYWIIKEDSASAERLPPEGEPSIERYIERVSQNLAALRHCPTLKVGFEWSALELEQLAADAPAVFAEMCALAREGRLAFYNGTYAQPHLQTLSSEANLRQFEHGLRVYRELCGQPVRVYAHQEASVHDQLPQLLRAFGLQYAVVPAFASTLGWLDEGELEIVAGRGPRFIEGHEFVAWRGLDGSEVPLYLQQPMDRKLEDFIAYETMLEKLRVPPVLLSTPDMISLDDDWLACHADVELVLLDEVLPQRFAQYPPRAHARFYTNWAYIEGVRAEELSRHNWRAEAAALQAEGLNALAYVLAGRPVDPVDGIWHSILATQHHDVYWEGSTELKDKCICWLEEARVGAECSSARAAAAVAGRVDCTGPTDQAVVVLNSVPHPGRSLVTLSAPSQDLAVLNARGEVLPAEVATEADGSAQLTFLAHTAGLGYTTYWLAGGGCPVQQRELTAPLQFQNDYYRVSVLPDGTFASLALLPSGRELLDTRVRHGNELAATDSTGLSPRHEGVPGYRRWEPPARGPELRWEATGPAVLRESSLGTTLVVHGQMGPRVSAELTARFYRDLARIDLAWAFTFDEASIGTLYDDSTKLRVQWPLAVHGDIYHDIAFGAVREWPGRPFYPAGWTDISDGSSGLAYFHRGLSKHWVEGDVLVNLLAWGENTEAIGSRLYRVNNPIGYDLRLRGMHVIQRALYPHSGDWRSADVIGAAREYANVPLAHLCRAHPGELPSSLNLLALADPNAAATCVGLRGSQLVCRMYAGNGRPATPGVSGNGLRPAELRTLAGERVDHLSPYQIGELALDLAGA